MATPDSRGQGNPVTDWHVGEPKTPTYDGFRVVDSRRISRECRDEAAACLYRVQHARWLREFAAWWQPIVATKRDYQPSWPVVPDDGEWTVVSDVRLGGEAAAAALGLDDEWRAMLGMPPLSDNDAAV